MRQNELLRPRFEAWAIANLYSTRKVPGGEDPSGGPVYSDPRTHAAWWAWQEATAASAMPATHTTFKLGDYAIKKLGSQWEGLVCGWYATAENPEGYAIESSAHLNSVQIYPAKALRKRA